MSPLRGFGRVGSRFHGLTPMATTFRPFGTDVLATDRGAVQLLTHTKKERAFGGHARVSSHFLDRVLPKRQLVHDRC